MASFKTLDTIGDISGKRVLVRVDLNVPMAEGKVTDATRIERVLPTITELSDKGAKVILLAHFGRPKDGPDPALSMRPIAMATEELLGRKVGFAGDCIGEGAAKAVASMKDGDILLLENTRFHKGEEKNDKAFTRGFGQEWRYFRKRRVLGSPSCAFVDGRAWLTTFPPLRAAQCRPSLKRSRKDSAALPGP